MAGGALRWAPAEEGAAAAREVPLGAVSLHALAGAGQEGGAGGGYIYLQVEDGEEVGELALWAPPGPGEGETLQAIFDALCAGVAATPAHAPAAGEGEGEVGEGLPANFGEGGWITSESLQQGEGTLDFAKLFKEAGGGGGGGG